MPQLPRVALLLTVASQLAGQAPFPTTVKLRVGESFDFVTTQSIASKDRYAGSQSTTCEFTVTIKSVREDGTLDAVVTWRRILGTMSGPRTASFDTAKSEEDQKGLVAPDLLAGLRAYVGLEQRVSYDKAGTVTDLPDQEAALKAATGKGKGFSQLQLRGLLGEAETRGRLRVLQTLPAAAKARGDQWLGPVTGRLLQHLGSADQLRYEVTAVNADSCTIGMTLAAQPPTPAGTKSATDPAVPPPDPSKPRDVAVRNLGDASHVADAQIQGELTLLSSGVVAREKLQARVRRATPAPSGEGTLTLDRDLTQTLELVVRDKSDGGK
jgi:hypothetical protein